MALTNELYYNQILQIPLVPLSHGVLFVKNLCSKFG